MPNLAYHLALLALEEIGKAGLILAEAAVGSRRDSGSMDKWVSSHSRKLLWALWTPFGKITPADFNKAKALAERLHAQRLAGLYVDPSAEDFVPQKAVSLEEAQSTIDLAASLLRAQPMETQATKVDPARTTLLEWFLKTVDDPEGARQLFSVSFLAKYQELDGDAKRWAEWAKDEFEKRAAESDEAMRLEFARRPVSKSEKPKWQIRARIYTISHSLRPKVLNYWNERIKIIKLIWTGKKDEFLLEVTLSESVVVSELYDRALALTKMTLAFLCVGTIGYFWFEKPAFTKQFFEGIKDFDRPKFKLQVGPRFSFWDENRAIALTEQHLQQALECMSTFFPMNDKTAEPIFGPYFHGLALLAKSDTNISTEAPTRQAFRNCLRAAMQHFGAWDGEDATFRYSLDHAFTSLIPDSEHRAFMFTAFDPVKIERGPISQDTLKMKHITDLFLIKTARERWRERTPDKNGPEDS